MSAGAFPPVIQEVFVEPADTAPGDSALWVSTSPATSRTAELPDRSGGYSALWLAKFMVVILLQLFTNTFQQQQACPAGM